MEQYNWKQRYVNDRLTPAIFLCPMWSPLWNPIDCQWESKKKGANTSFCNVIFLPSMQKTTFKEETGRATIHVPFAQKKKLLIIFSLAIPRLNLYGAWLHMLWKPTVGQLTSTSIGFGSKPACLTAIRYMWWASRPSVGLFGELETLWALIKRGWNLLLRLCVWCLLQCILGRSSEDRARAAGASQGGDHQEYCAALP